MSKCTKNGMLLAWSAAIGIWGCVDTLRSAEADVTTVTITDTVLVKDCTPFGVNLNGRNLLKRHVEVNWLLSGDILTANNEFEVDRPQATLTHTQIERFKTGHRLETRGDGTMGHPVEPFYHELPCAERIRVPRVRKVERMSAVPAFYEICGNRYRLASLDLSGFTVYTLLRGFENAMQDFLLEPDGFAALLDRIIDFECELMRMAAHHGFDGIHLADDWGTQSGLMISPEMWRQLFKPLYARQFALARELRLHVWYHCCGEFLPIMKDFHDIGVDVLNISQPNVNDIAEVGRRLRGRQCFMMPISYQTVSIQGTPEEIHAEAQRLYDLLAVPEGGFIGYVEEYSVMGMSARNYRACGEAFRGLGCD